MERDFEKNAKIKAQTRSFGVRRAIEFSVLGWDDHFPRYLGDTYTFLEGRQKYSAYVEY